MTSTHRHEAGSLSVAYSIADQNFIQTKSLGILNLSLQLADALAGRIEFQTFDVFSNSSLEEWHGRFAGRRVHRFDRACSSRIGRMFWDQVQVYSEAAKAGVDWLFLPKGFSSFSRRPGVRIAAYVHDTIGEFYRERYPHATSRAEAWYFHRSLLATVKHSTVIFTNSDFTRGELLKLGARYAIPAPRIVVAGIGFRASPTALRSAREDIVMLASPLPHKRTDLAVRYLTAWQESARFTGKVHWVGRFPQGATPPARPGWMYHDRLDEVAYRSLVSESRVLVYFSEYEGFGMPPVEATLNGAYPVYSSIPATQEVMQGLGSAFDNSSLESFINAMNAALAAHPAAVIAAARELSARHAWNAVADRIIAELRSLPARLAT